MWMLNLVAGNWQRILIHGLVIAGALATAAGWGYLKGVQRLWDYQAEQAVQAAKIVVKQGEVTEKVVVEYVEVAGKAKVIEQRIEVEVIRYAQLNPGMCLDTDWGRLYDASIDAFSEATGAADAAGRETPTAAAALKTTTENNARCVRNSQRLEALQKWVINQCEANPPEGGCR